MGLVLVLKPCQAGGDTGSELGYANTEVITGVARGCGPTVEGTGQPGEGWEVSRGFLREGLPKGWSRSQAEKCRRRNL